MNYQHKELAGGRWAQMSLCEQMANVGSEVSRALNWKAKNNNDYSHKALERALELLDITLDSQTQYPRLKEVARVREILVDYFMADNQHGSTELLWRKYFDAFAVAANRNK